jgi:hypothetical protein
MRKALLALGVLVIGLFVALVTFQSQPEYAEVSMAKKDYEQLQTSKANLDDLLNHLATFDHERPKALQLIKEDAKKIVDQNGQNLSDDDQKALNDALYHKSRGIVSIAQEAYDRHYNFDGSIASGFHDPMMDLIKLSVNGVNQSSAQRAKIEAQLQEDLDIEQKLYRIGANNE